MDFFSRTKLTLIKDNIRSPTKGKAKGGKNSERNGTNQNYACDIFISLKDKCGQDSKEKWRLTNIIV